VEDKEGPVWTELKKNLALDNDEFEILESRGRDRGKIKKELDGGGGVFKKK
jgi:hypothetical protein